MEKTVTFLRMPSQTPPLYPYLEAHHQKRAVTPTLYKRMLASNIRPFLQTLRGETLEPYDILSHGVTVSYQANEYIHWKLQKSTRANLKKAS